MPNRAIRFGVTNGPYRSSTWKCWSRTGTGKHDVYLTCRALRGALKLSLHQSGNWHLGFDRNFLEKEAPDSSSLYEDRFVQKWRKPDNIAPGIHLPFRIIIPNSAVTIPYKRKDLKKSLHLISTAEDKAAIEVLLFITEKDVKTSNWPGKNSMSTKLIDSFEIENESTVWFVYHEIEMPELTNLNFNSNNATQFKSALEKRDGERNLRTIIFGKNEKDRSRYAMELKIDSVKPSLFGEGEKEN